MVMFTRNTASIVTLTFIKLMCAVALALFAYDWWRYGVNGSDQVVQSCSNPTVGRCNSFCGDVMVVNVNITDVDYSIDDAQYGFPEISTFSHFTNEPYCIADFRGQCAYKYWLLFKLVPIMLHVLGFVLQCVTWWHYKDFTPQQRQYDSIIAHMYPDLYSGEQDATIGGVDESRQKNIRGMFAELLLRPSDSVFAFIEMATVGYVWGELWHPPIYCGSVRPLSLYYYPILMSALELTKFNVYVGIRVCTTGRQLAIAKCSCPIYGSALLWRVCSLVVSPLNSVAGWSVCGTGLATTVGSTLWLLDSSC